MTSSLDPPPKPRFRGVSHLYACVLAVVAALILVWIASSLRARVAASIYGVSLAALFGVSALYHLNAWRPRVEPWMRRLDHMTIFVFIAASYTPFCLLALHPDTGSTLLCIVWTFAALGILRALLWIEAPPWVCALLYLAQGWIFLPYLPYVATSIGALGITMIAFAGLCYTVGAVIFSLGRPDPAPAVFGYHEIFHLLVIAGSACQFGAVTRLVASG